MAFRPRRSGRLVVLAPQLAISRGFVPQVVRNKSRAAILWPTGGPMSRHSLKSELYAEFLGTFILIMFGAGVVAQKVLSESNFGSYLAVNLGWGLGVTMGVYVAASISGAHLNPAVSLAFAWRRRLPWGKVLPYSL